jgi:uncharacterized protein YceH (UPF0502 family)
MDPLTADECRVLGVLIEKAQTTPGQYPLTINGLMTGCNQKSNREPVMELDEDRVLESVDSLRGKDLVREVTLSGSRVAKYRHIARDTLGLSTNELVVLAELLLRGPQTVGELRGRATRMHTLESTEIVSNILESLMTPEPPLAERLSPAPGSRAPRYKQLLAPNLHPVDTTEAPARGASSG